MRPSERAPDLLRPIVLETAVTRYAEGSCLISAGHTKVLVTASLEEGVPGFLRGKGQGWVTAEYGMLPRATHHAHRREAATGKQFGRTQDIQRLIERARCARWSISQARRAPDHASIATSSRPMAAPAPRRSPAHGSRCGSQSTA